MTVHFIGAGPGAADLITMRGFELLSRAPVCLYAGSLVPQALLKHCPAAARIVDTAPMSLDEIEAEFAKAHAAGEDVARLHSGDLSVWSAMGEQLRRLRRLGIPYTITPGVPSFAAAAAALGQELTLPEVGQSLVLTRTSGRASAMPPTETLEAFAATRATLAIHLSVHVLADVAARLAPFYGADCPAAVVFRASLAGRAHRARHAGGHRGDRGAGAHRAHRHHLCGRGAGRGGVPRERALQRGLSAALSGANLEKACSRAFLKDAHFGCMRRGTRRPEHDVDGCGGGQIKSFTCKGQDIRERVEHLRLLQILGIDRKFRLL